MSTTSADAARSVLEGMYRAEAQYLAAGGPGTVSFAPLAPFFSTEVVLEQADTLPYGGTWRGHDGLERFFRAMSEVWDRFEMTDQTFLSGTNPLVVLTRVHARARATGRELAFPILQTITVADGRIAEIHPFYWDTAAVAAACSTGMRRVAGRARTARPGCRLSVSRIAESRRRSSRQGSLGTGPCCHARTVVRS